MNCEEDRWLAFEAAGDTEERVREIAYAWLADIATPEAIVALDTCTDTSFRWGDVTRARRWVRAKAAGVAYPEADRQRAESRATAVEPLEARTVPKLTLRSLTETPPANATAKFGGQPDWVSDPAWPHAPDGRPLVFYGQLPLPNSDATAFIFVNQDERAFTFDALGTGNAVVVQPGPPTHLDTRPHARGPQLYVWEHDDDRLGMPSRSRPYCRWVLTEPGTDPPAWTWPNLPDGQYPEDVHGDWNKVGGTPQFLQGEEQPPGDGWHFAFQFTASWAGEEMGDGAECYGFVNDDGSGAFLWQCH